MRSTCADPWPRVRESLLCLRDTGPQPSGQPAAAGPAADPRPGRGGVVSARGGRNHRGRRLLRFVPCQRAVVVHRGRRRVRQGRGGCQGHGPGPVHPARRRRPAPLACRRSPAPELRAAGPAAGRPVRDRRLRHLPRHPRRHDRPPVLCRASACPGAPRRRARAADRRSRLPARDSSPRSSSPTSGSGWRPATPCCSTPTALPRPGSGQVLRKPSVRCSARTPWPMPWPALTAWTPPPPSTTSARSSGSSHWWLGQR